MRTTNSWVSKGLSDFSREFYEFTMPAIDMFEDDDTKELIVKIDPPGYAKKDIRLSIDEDVLRIRANRERYEELQTGSVYYEHRPREIDKKIILPIAPQDSKKIVGAETYVEGVVTVRISTVQPRNIQFL
jgi:HSP20 family protein